MKRIESNTWTIEEDGSLYCKSHDYWIEKDRLAETDWIMHMMSKGWIDLNEFIPVYMSACSRAGLKQVTVDTFDRSGFIIEYHKNFDKPLLPPNY